MRIAEKKEWLLRPRALNYGREGARGHVLVGDVVAWRAATLETHDAFEEGHGLAGEKSRGQAAHISAHAEFVDDGRRVYNQIPRRDESPHTAPHYGEYRLKAEPSCGSTTMSTTT